MNVISFFTWCENSAIGTAIRSSLWLFPGIEVIHLLGLAVIGGVVLILNMRMLGLGLRNRTVAQLARDTRPWLLASLTVMLVSGSLLFLSEAVKCYYHPAFWVKMASLALAILFTFTVQRKVALADPARMSPVWGKAVAVISMILWSGVGIGGRWIGFQ
jgi:hypothetical protein